MASLTRDEFVSLVRSERSATPGVTLAVPVGVRLLSDQLTPVLAYRRLVAPDERTAPSFLLESVEGGERQGRYSILGARPALEVVARRFRVRISDHATGRVEEGEEANPLLAPRGITAGVRLVRPPSGARPALPACPLGGWFGYASYDTVRYAEPEKLPFEHAPSDDRGLPEMHFGLYDGVVAFDHVDKLVHVVRLAMLAPGDEAGEAYDRAVAAIEARIAEIERHSKPLPAGRVEREGVPAPLRSNVTREQHAAMVERALEHIRAGDIFQVVIGQRFERVSEADPFDVYRALRAVNPSPYMVYMQGEGCILVASSPEILCRVRRGGDGALVVTNRPLAGTRPRGRTPEEDAGLERELLADEKERAEHVMLVDLGRNDVGRVAVPGTIELPAVMEVERYSHVMHISSTVTGVLREGLDAWDALAATLPVGTISGAPKIRAMQIIDELEPVRRGPYGGGMGYVSLDGEMDIALALRTMVVPTASVPRGGRGSWTYYLQAAGGIVADSKAEPEYLETVNKAAALARAIDLAESAFGA
ncbi:MAG: anthranilate synthase component I [Leptolyngbya sp. PLA2]|nr:anthranilate synthase component I [Leptolyngbya sp.]MCE7971711.1 anthranilate synthase component I [Leptolyngbya sp. PL-A2]MDL1904850.1 anthranilate synthase component I [Synechococcales cyanobacterium CNB]GIK19665.1 MAG: anthranilate synthase component I [Planctomycetota bacterium]